MGFQWRELVLSSTLCLQLPIKQNQIKYQNTNIRIVFQNFFPQSVLIFATLL